MLDFIGFINDNINLSATEKQALLDDFCEAKGYPEEIDGEPNPETKKEYANKKISTYIKNQVDDLRRERAEKASKFDELVLG